MRSLNRLLISIPLLLASTLNAQVAVSLDKMNALYPSGVENLVTIAVTDIPDSNLLLVPSMGEIRRKGWGITYGLFAIAIPILPRSRSEML